MDIENWDGKMDEFPKINYMEAMGNLSMDAYVRIYGELPSHTVLKGMTQEFIKSYHTLGVDSMHLVDGYGLDWIESLLTHNEEVEEYELCTIFRDLIIEYETTTILTGRRLRRL